MRRREGSPAPMPGRGGRRERLRLAFTWRRAAFVLPNLFTLSGTFCGLFAILLAAGTPGAKQFHQAAMAIFFGIFFDMADGRLARMTRTQSEFGMQMDSLSDVLTFGMAPAVVVHRWALGPLGLAGAGVAFVYLACGAMRLARFNVLAAREVAQAKSYFVGLPIPFAAGVLTSLVMYHQDTYAAATERATHVLVLMLVLSALMVSNIRYRTFRDVAVNRLSMSLFLAALLSFIGLAAWVQPTLALLVLFFGYAGVGVVEAMGRWATGSVRRAGGTGA